MNLFTTGLMASAAQSGIAAWFEQMKMEFTLNFIMKDRWKLLLTGLKNTLVIALFACLIGIALGLIVAAVRTTWDKNAHTMHRGVGKTLLRIVDAICRVYITVIRGTPVVVQLMIMYYIIFASSDNGVLVATLAFGFNSGAYVAEIFRGGIMSIDKGQFEAGRSLGLNYLQTMWYIIIPQAFKAVLPSLANEFITLLKESSVAFYIGVADLTLGGLRIRSITYSNYMPLIAVALIYLILVLGLSKCVSILERRLRKSDNR